MTNHIDPGSGAARGRPRLIIRAEGACLLLLATWAYFQTGHHWLWFAIFFLAPDLSMLGYLAGPVRGALAYNIAHNLILPAALGLAGMLSGAPGALAASLIWTAHIGFDRVLGYGLKYETAFGDTHLGWIGKRKPDAAI